MNYDLGNAYGMGASLGLASALAGVFGIALFIYAVVYIAESLGLMKLFEKAKQNPAVAFVPFYRHYVKFKLVWEGKGWLGVVISIMSCVCGLGMVMVSFADNIIINEVSYGTSRLLNNTIIADQLEKTSFIFCSLSILAAAVFIINLFMYYKMTRSYVSKIQNFPSFALFVGLALLPLIFVLVLGFSKDYTYRGISTGSVGDNYFDDSVTRRIRSLKKQSSYAAYREKINNLDPALRRAEFQTLDGQIAKNAEDDVRLYTCIASYVACACIVLAWYFGGSLFVVNYVSFGCLGFVLAFINYSKSDKPYATYQIIPMVLNALLVVGFSIASVL